MTWKEQQKKIANRVALPSINEKEDFLYTYRNIFEEDPKVIPKLYRYSPANYWNIRSLETKELRLIQAAKMNDIYEGYLYCTDDMNEQCINFQTSVYLKSFSQTNRSLLMWATYADEYRGMCVEYDFTSDAASECRRMLYPVSYSKKRFAHDSQNNINANAFFFIKKGIEWKYEQEWRLIKLNRNQNFENDNLNTEIVNTDFIKAVYLGKKINKSIETHICEIAVREKFEVFQAEIEGDEFAINPRHRCLVKRVRGVWQCLL